MCQSAFQLCSWLQSEENTSPLTSETKRREKREEESDHVTTVQDAELSHSCTVLNLATHSVTPELKITTRTHIRCKYCILQKVERYMIIYLCIPDAYKCIETYLIFHTSCHFSARFVSKKTSGLFSISNKSISDTAVGQCLYIN